MKPETEARYRAATEAKCGSLSDEEWATAKWEFETKQKARRLVNKNIRAGIIRREPCERCGSPNAHAHHPNYLQPLAVIWLCPLHHKRDHIRLAKLTAPELAEENYETTKRGKALMLQNLDHQQVRNLLCG